MRYRICQEENENYLHLFLQKKGRRFASRGTGNPSPTMYIRKVMNPPLIFLEFSGEGVEVFFFLCYNARKYKLRGSARKMER